MHKENEGPDVTIYTDGACTGNPGPGGWGASLSNGKKTKDIWGGEPDTTNNRMELMAVIKALEALKKPLTVHLFTDSTYVVDGATKWIKGWKRKGWKRGRSGTKRIENLDLWQRIDELMSVHKVKWEWVRGHSGNPGNERADMLANRGLSPVSP